MTISTYIFDTSITTNASTNFDKDNIRDVMEHMIEDLL